MAQGVASKRVRTLPDASQRNQCTDNRPFPRRCPPTYPLDYVRTPPRRGWRLYSGCKRQRGSHDTFGPGFSPPTPPSAVRTRGLLAAIRARREKLINRPTLLTRGFVKARTAHVGGKDETVYEITAAGRKALEKAEKTP